MAKEIELQNAIDKADLGMVKRLLAKGAKVSSKTSLGDPILHWVVIKIWNFRGEKEQDEKVPALREIGKLLVERGAPVDIYSAACLGYVEQTAALLAKRPELVKGRFPCNDHPLTEMAGYVGEAGPEIFALLKKAKRAVPPFDWDKAERDLYDAAIDDIRRRAKRDGKKTFSAFAFDCDSGNGSLGMKFNEASHVLDTEWNPVGDFSHGSELHQDHRVRDLLLECTTSNAAGKRFMELCCRVALRLEREKAFSPLRTSDPFDIIVSDHDETLKAAVSRLKRVRGQVGSATSSAKAKASSAGKAKAKAKAKATAPAPTKAATKPTKSSRATHLEYSEGSSNKFWEIEVNGAAHTVRFGKIGAAGQTSTKSFASAKEAQQDADKLMAQKRKKGYR